MANARVSSTVVMFNQDSNEITIERVVEASAEVVETVTGLYSIASAKTYVDPSKGNLVYVFNADIPAKIEAENLKLLRRSVTLKKLFDFERTTGGVDWVKILPYLIIIIMVLFHK